jgi:PAS domain-containing protein
MNNPPRPDPATPAPEAQRTDLDVPADLWKLLWDFDPNGLFVLDDSMCVTLVNPAMCQMLKADRNSLLGRKAAELLGDISDFERAYREQKEVVGQEVSYPIIAAQPP